jgi:hypothetical protein
VSEPGYSIDIGELVVEEGPASVEGLTREVEAELRRLLAAPADAARTPKETSAQRIARAVHARLQEGRRP